MKNIYVMRILAAFSFCLAFFPLLLSNSIPRILVGSTDLGRLMQSSTPLFISYCCLISATVPMLIDIFFDMAMSFSSRKHRSTKKATKEVNMFVGERLFILVGMVVPALIHVAVLVDSDVSGPIVGLVNINCIVAECFCILGIVFVIGESIYPGRYFKNYLCSLVMCIILMILIYIHLFAENGGGFATLFFICFVSGCLFLHFGSLYRTTLRAYFSSSASNPNSLDAQNAFTLLIYETFGLLYTLGKRLIVGFPHKSKHNKRIH